ncbi:LysR family transcriptional regulator [Piscinibacter sakaiensis]|uniref:LysR family transcriptional regulator n=1 Tax=Piscinibacter sakaiensis TaxID=1547922 RepID=UPI003AAEFAA1
MKNLTLRQLRAFQAVAESESFTLAAERLHLTPAALSGLIKELENQLGVTLFDRNTRKVGLSAVGAEFHPLTERVLQDLDDAVSNITHLKEMRRGIVRLAAPEVMSCTLVPAAMAEFRERYPQVEVRFFDVPLEEVIERTARGEIDLGIAPGSVTNPEIDRVPFMRAPLWLAVPRKHALARRSKVAWEDVKGHTFISFFRGFAQWAPAQFGAQGGDLLPQDVLAVRRINTALSMAQAGFGFTACPVYARDLAAGFGLSLVRLIGPEVRREYALLLRKGHSPPPAVEALRDFLLSFSPAWAASFAKSKS